MAREAGDVELRELFVSRVGAGAATQVLDPKERRGRTIVELRTVSKPVELAADVPLEGAKHLRFLRELSANVNISWPPCLRHQRRLYRVGIVAVAQNSVREKLSHWLSIGCAFPPLLRAGGRPLIAELGGRKSGRFGRRISIHSCLERQLQSLTSHGQSRISEGHLARLDPVSTRRVLQCLEGLGKLLFERLSHLMHQQVAIHGPASRKPRVIANQVSREQFHRANDDGHILRGFSVSDALDTGGSHR